MENVVKNFNLIKQEITDKKNVKIVAVTKTFPISHILPVINEGHTDFGENKVQEAMEKWTSIKQDFPKINLHLLGKLQTNKVKTALTIFDFIHSLDSQKLAKKIADEQLKQNKKVKVFIQVNIGNEDQKSGIKKQDLNDFYSYCKKLNLDVIGLMCLPPIDLDPVPFFKELKILNTSLNLPELSMGMSADYIKAVENFSTYLRIGSNIFGKRI